MIQELATSPEFFVDRRANDVSDRSPAFDAGSFPIRMKNFRPRPSNWPCAIDGYKLRHRRRFITYEEMLSVVKSLGYAR